MTIFEQDRPLLDRFRRGERSALERVYRRYVDDVIALVRMGFVSGEARVRGDRRIDTQLDLAHDVFLKAFAEPARLAYDGLRPYRPYLLRIGKNHVVDLARKAGRLVALEDTGKSEDELAGEQSAEPEAELHAERLRKATAEFLAEQPEQVQTFVQLRFVDELSQYEVLDRMGLTRRKIRTLEKQVQSDLRRHLQKRGLRWA